MYIPFGQTDQFLDFLHSIDLGIQTAIAFCTVDSPSAYCQLTAASSPGHLVGPIEYFSLNEGKSAKLIVSQRTP
jgi:hypothetical protein